MNLLEQFDPGTPLFLSALSAAAIVAILVVATELLTFIFRRSNPRLRHTLWLVTLLFCILSPLLVRLAEQGNLVVVPIVKTRVEPPQISPREFLTPDPEKFERPEPKLAVVVTKTEPIAEPIAPAITPKPGQPFTWTHARGLMILLYFAGVIFLGIRLAFGFFTLFRIKHSAVPLDPAVLASLVPSIRDALATSKPLPPIATSSLPLEVPIAAGVFRPVVIIPAPLIEKLSHEQLRDVLVHECAHALRHDGFVGLLQRLTTLLFWPHPLIHWLNRRLTMVREEICDDYVLTGGDPARYAEGLLNLALTISHHRTHPPAPGMLNGSSGLERRVIRILEPGRTRPMRPHRGLTILFTCVLASLAILVSGIRPVAQAMPQDKQVAKPQSDPKPANTIIKGIVVDEADKPVVGATILPRMGPLFPKLSTQSGPDGQFTLDMGRSVTRVETIARHDEQKLMGVALHQEYISPPSQPLRIVMHPTKTVRVLVVDGNKKPVAGANVTAEIQVPVGVLEPEKTGQDGVTQLIMPNDAKLLRIIGYKDHIGYDYAEMYSDSSSSVLKPVPAEVTLTLDSAQTVKVRAVDMQNKPLAGVRFFARILRWGKLERPSISAMLSEEPTGPDGTQALTFLPDHGIANIYGSLKDNEPLDEPLIRENSDLSQVLTIRFRKLGRVSGRVTHPDGSPAPGISIHTNAGGKDFGYTKTDAEGRYSLPIACDRSYLVAVVDRKFACPAIGNVVVRDDQLSRVVGFRLGPGTRLHGRFMLDKNGRFEGLEPTSLRLGLTVLGPVLEPEFQYPVRPNDPQRNQLSVICTADQNGNYEQALAKGDYIIRYPDGKEENIHVDGTGELIRDVTEPIPPKLHELTGMVVDASQGTPEKTLKGVRVRAYHRVVNPPVPTDQLMRGNNTLSNDQGRFTLNITEESSALTAQTVDGKLAGFVEITPTSNNVTLRLKPAAEVTGQLLDSSGKPFSASLVGMVMLESSDASPTKFVTFTTKMNPSGQFRLSGIIPRGKFNLVTRIVAGPRRGESITIKTLTIDHPGVFDLGDFTVPDLSKPKP